jgi:hypothetical protein
MSYNSAPNELKNMNGLKKKNLNELIRGQIRCKTKINHNLYIKLQYFKTRFCKQYTGIVGKKCTKNCTIEIN